MTITNGPKLLMKLFFVSKGKKYTVNHDILCWATEWYVLLCPEFPDHLQSDVGKTSDHF